ncbi:MAG: hypothetical protein ABI675_24375 [Chitinophagaceae bacterium]
MNTVESLYMEMPFTVEEFKQTAVDKSKDKNSYHEKDGNLAINNYLKTPEEIDAELSSSINTRTETFAEHPFLMDSYGKIFKNRSDNAYSPDNSPSGFMEENY